jgi:hypothetical protein
MGSWGNSCCGVGERIIGRQISGGVSDGLGQGGGG